MKYDSLIKDSSLINQIFLKMWYIHWKFTFFFVYLAVFDRLSVGVTNSTIPYNIIFSVIHRLFIQAIIFKSNTLSLKHPIPNTLFGAWNVYTKIMWYIQILWCLFSESWMQTVNGNKNRYYQMKQFFHAMIFFSISMLFH